MKQFLMTALLAGSLAAFTGCKDDDGGKSQNYPSQIPAAEKIPVMPICSASRKRSTLA